MKRNLSKGSMISLVAAAIILIATIFVPWWGMKFYAPQYPEGLDIVVTPTALEGDIDNINALNHYIGMKQFSTETFPELQYMSYIIIAVAVLIIIAAFIRSKTFLSITIGIYAFLGALGIWDMWKWLKAFGTDLDPQAPIDMEPFVPPIIGENTIANFVTNSYFTTGAYLLLAVFILLVLPFWIDRSKQKRSTENKRHTKFTRSAHV